MGDKHEISETSSDESSQFRMYFKKNRQTSKSSDSEYCQSSPHTPRMSFSDGESLALTPTDELFRMLAQRYGLDRVADMPEGSATTGLQQDTPQVAPSDVHPWNSNEVGFFDPSSFGYGGIVQIEGGTYFRDVYLFVERVKQIAEIRDADTVKANLSLCLRGSALMWFMVELTQAERDDLRSAGPGIERWCTTLTKRFKVSTYDGWTSLLAEKYTVTHAHNGRPPAAYVHAILRHARDAGFTAPHHQLAFAWINTDAELGADMPRPAESTHVSDYIALMEHKVRVWQVAHRSAAAITRRATTATLRPGPGPAPPSRRAALLAELDERKRELVALRSYIEESWLRERVAGLSGPLVAAAAPPCRRRGVSLSGSPRRVPDLRTSGAGVGVRRASRPAPPRSG